MPSINKELKAGLVLLASHLPEEKALVGERIGGRQLLEESPLARAAGNQPINPAATYRRMVAKGSVNHPKRLVRAYERGGRNAVLAYCKKYIEPAHFDVFAEKLSQLVPA